MELEGQKDPALRASNVLHLHGRLKVPCWCFGKNNPSQALGHMSRKTPSRNWSDRMSRMIPTHDDCYENARIQGGLSTPGLPTIPLA